MTQMDGAVKTIGPDTYRVRHLDPFTAADLAVDLTEILGPVLGSLGSAVLSAKDSKQAFQQLMDGGDGAENPLGESLEKAILEFVNRLSKEKQRHIIQTLAAVTTVQKEGGEPSLESIFAVHFRGRMKAMYEWLIFAIRTQYADFLSA